MTITSDNYDYLRTDILFEWTFAVLVINLTLQIYRLVAQVASLVFDVFKLTYGKSLFGPLTDTDLKAYGNYFTARNELLFKLSESVVLLITAYYGAKSLLNFSVLGLAIQSVIFILHVIVLTLGIIFLVDSIQRLFSLETLTWLLIIATEATSVVLSLLAITRFSG